MSRKMTYASEMRFRVTLQSPVETADGAGGIVRSWQTEAQVWARALPVAGGAEIEGGQVHSSLRMRMLLRLRSDMDESWRIVFAGKQYRVDTIEKSVEQKGMMEVSAREVISA